MIDKIILLCGLPGSGKSTYAEGLIKTIQPGRLCSDYTTINFDHCKNEDDIDDCLNCGYYRKNLILDGLFLTNDMRVRILNKVWSKMDISKYPEIKICEWRENREACLTNDEGRRDKTSRIMILNAKWEPVDPKFIAENLKFKCAIPTVEYFDVKEWSPREKVLSEGDENGKLYSDSWCGGGTWGSWSGQKGNVGAEPPVEFTQLDDLLSKYRPDITFLQYKRLMAKCVETEESYERDYYGGSTINYRYVCDLKKLVEFLEEI